MRDITVCHRCDHFAEGYYPEYFIDRMKRLYLWREGGGVPLFLKFKPVRCLHHCLLDDAEHPFSFGIREMDVQYWQQPVSRRCPFHLEHVMWGQNRESTRDAKRVCQHCGTAMTGRNCNNCGYGRFSEETLDWWEAHSKGMPLRVKAMAWVAVACFALALGVYLAVVR